MLGSPAHVKFKIKYPQQAPTCAAPLLKPARLAGAPWADPNAELSSEQRRPAA